MTLQDAAQAVSDTALSRGARRLYEHIAFVAFLALAVLPVVFGLASHPLNERVVALAPTIASAEAALGIFLGWLKTLGHRENIQEMKGSTS